MDDHRTDDAQRMESIIQMLITQRKEIRKEPEQKTAQKIPSKAKPSSKPARTREPVQIVTRKTKQIPLAVSIASVRSLRK